MIIKGTYNKAKIYTKNIEKGAINQIQNVCNSKVFEGAKIKIMPDVHEGAGCTIGTTMTIHDKVVPNMVGVDIGCGMEVVELAEKLIDYKALDEFIYANIPSGMSCRATRHEYSYNIDLNELACANRVNLGRGYLSIGTLGGGNHFIEVDKDEQGNLYLVVHSGSRYIGLQVAEYYQNEAQRYHATGGKSIQQIINELKNSGREKEIQTTLENIKQSIKNSEDPFANLYLEKELFDNYIHDMQIMQHYADLNRRAITDDILQGLNLHEVGRFTTVHNYIDTKNMILRKGAVSARKGERLLIPINMRDGSLICIGKGNANWNCSAPHGAGRILSRTKAKATLSLQEFQAQMQGIYSSSINENTLDESPMAYKNADEIIKNIKPTATIEKQIFPVYNFKASEDSGKTRRRRK